MHSHLILLFSHLDMLDQVIDRQIILIDEDFSCKWSSFDANHEFHEYYSSRRLRRHHYCDPY